MTASPAVYLAGHKTADDWRDLRQKLVSSSNEDLWREAFQDYFLQRLSLRYLEPIRVIQENGTFQGEGFSIVAIQCTLIEFLESTAQGLSYRYLRPGEQLGPHEYSDSSRLFSTFLCSRQPFASEFNKELARDFYVSVRCGLLHEARTKNGWTIWAKAPSGNVMISAAEKIVFRDNFHAALLTHIDWYREALLMDTALQEGFIRKFDSLCE